LLHHVALGARDVEAVAAFYREAFRLRERARHHDADGSLRSVWLELGDSVLMIEQSQEPPRRVEGVGAGPFLLAFHVGPEERADLERALGKIESRTEHTSYARDPEGNRVAVSSYPLAAQRVKP
jgi:glyoxylase I family protein